MKKFAMLLVLLSVGMLSLGLVGCTKTEDGGTTVTPSSVGDTVEGAVEATGEAIEGAGEAIEEAADDAGAAVEGAAETVLGEEKPADATE